MHGRRVMYAPLLFALFAAALSMAARPSAAIAQEVRPLDHVPPRPPTGEPAGLLPEPGWVERLSVFFDRKLGNGELLEGWSYGQGNLVPGAGWPSAGLTYRRWYAKDRVVADGTAAVSWRGFKAAQLRVEAPALWESRLLAGWLIRLQDFPALAHFGEGSDTASTDRSEYHLKSANVVAYATYRPLRWLGFEGHAGWLEPALASRTVPGFVHAGVAMVADTRDFAGHPTSGGVYRLSAADFSDRGTGTFSFRRYEAEAAQFLAFADARVVLAVHGWLVGSGADDVVPFYLQPSLGGHNALRGYPEYRFHDRNLLLLNVEARMAMMSHVDAAVFVDAGNVAARARDLNLAKRSYGAGLRLHSRRQTFVRLDAARGDEGWRLVLRLDDPLNLARLARRAAPVPFVH